MDRSPVPDRVKPPASGLSGYGGAGEFFWWRFFGLAFLPEFIHPTAGYGVFSFLFLGGTFMVTGTIGA